MDYRDRVWMVLGVILIFIVAIGSVVEQQSSAERKIKDWADEEGYVVTDIEQCFFSYGPFWYKDDDQSIYKARVITLTEENKTSYFRIGPWGFDQEWSE